MAIQKMSVKVQHAIPKYSRRTCTWLDKEPDRSSGDSFGESQKSVLLSALVWIGHETAETGGESANETLDMGEAVWS